MMLTFHDDKNLKERFVKELELHERQDRILQGTYGEIVEGEWKGCAVACSIRSLAPDDDQVFYNDHSLYESLLGVPQELAYLEDALFERLPVGDAKGWPKRFGEAIPVGVDLSDVARLFKVWLMGEMIVLVEGLNIADDLKHQVLDSVKQVRDVLNNPDADARAAIYDAARAARAASAAGFAARRDAVKAANAGFAARRDAVKAAANADRAAGFAAEAAAYADRAAYAAEAAANAYDRDAFTRKMCDKLIQIIKQQGTR